MIFERHEDGTLRAEADEWIVLRTHAEQADCREFGCVIHNPSDSPMSDFPMNWREDRDMMERICPHGTGHPDHDQVRFWARTMKWQDAWAEMAHFCDGCCRGKEEQDG